MPVARRSTTPSFGVSAKRHVERLIAATTQTVVAIGIQSREGAGPKEAAEAVEAQRDTGRIPTLAEVAASHEFGVPDATPPIPQRSFLRSTADRERKKWLRTFGAALKDYAGDDEAKYQTRLRALGLKAASDVRATIDARIEPPLSEYTIAQRRKGNRIGAGDPVPLRDTGQLYQSIRSAAQTPSGPLVLA
jgi:hypothetical protein